MKKTALFILSLWMLGSPLALAVTTEEMKVILSKSLLNEEDQGKVDTFVKDQFTAMMRASSSDAMKQAYEALVQHAQSTAAVDQTRQAYSNRYTASVLAYAAAAFNQAETMTDASLAGQLRLSAMKVLTATENAAIIDELIQRLSDPQMEIRYWALAGFAKPGMLDYLNYANDEVNVAAKKKVLDAITAALGQENLGFVIVRAIQTVKALADITEQADFFDSAVNTRVQLYEAWTVRDEFNDLALLKELFDTLLRSNFDGADTVRTRIVHSVSKLYAAAYYRYVTGMGYPVQENQTVNLLSSRSQDLLMAILLEGEMLFNRLTDNASMRSRFAVALKKYTGQGPGPKEEMQSYFDGLLGPTGVVTRQFALGTDPTTSPFAPLPAPPVQLVESSVNLQNLSSRLIEVEP